MIYLFNNKEELIHIIKEQDLIEFTHKIEINTFDAAEFELPIEAIDKEIIEQMRFFGFFVRGRQFGVFKAYEVTMNDNYIVKGLDRAESDLRTVRIIKDKRLQSVTADQALNVALEGTGYQLGEKEGLTKVNKTNFYYISPREALVKIIEAFNCEFRVRYEFVENKIINRYIDLYHRQGSYSGVQFEYGNNALEVTMEEDSDNVVTALIGRGKGEESTDSEGNATGGYGRRIEFTDIVWTKASGKPIDKPAGQNYIVLNDDIENKGLYQNGELKHRWGVFVDEEIEDKEVLLQATYQELLRLNNPIRKYKASILDLRDDIWLGDRVAIVKDSAKLSFEARIFSITIDKLNFDQSEVELGDYETLKSQSQSSSLNAIKEAIRELSEEQEAYNRKVQELIDNKNAEIAEKMRVMRLDMDNGIEDAKNKAEKVKQEVAAKVDETVKVASQKAKNEITQEFNAQYGDITVKMEELQATTDKLKTSDADIQKLINNFKAQAQSQFSGIQGAQSRFEQTTEKAISDLTNVANGKADRSYVEQTVAGVKEEFTSIGVSGGPNMLRNSRADEGLKYWTEANNKLAFTAHKFYFNGQKRMFELRPGAVVQSPRFIVKQNADYTLNFLGFDNNSKMFKVYFCKRRKGSISEFEEKQLIYDGKPRWTDGPVLDGNRAIKKSFQFNVGNFDDGYLQFEYERNNPNEWGGLFLTELDFYEGTNDRLWQPAPEDQNYLVEQAQATFEKTVEGLSTQLTKLETKTGPSGELEQRMLTYSEKAAVDALKATRQILEQGYVAKSQYTEDVAGITRRFDEIVQAGENLLKNSGNPQNVEGWGYYDPGLIPIVTVSTNPLYYNESRKLFKIENASDTTKAAASQRFNTKRNTTYTISFDAIGSSNLKPATFYFLARKKGETANFSKVFTLADKIAIPQDRITRYYFTVNSEEYDEAFLRFDNTGSSNGQTASLYFGDIDVYEGSTKRAYQPPTDNGSSVIEAKLAEYKQTVDGQFTTITNQIGDMLRKTDIQITPGQISFGVGKEINGRTISSLLVQEPEAIALIAKLIKVKGDMVVDGSIASRHLASQSVRTGHMESGSVTTQILASNAVTADKLLVDSAMINKLVSNQAFIRELTSQKAFITQLNSVAVSAERIQGGRLLSNNGATDFNLDNGSVNFYSNQGSIRRIDDTTSSQFIRLEQGYFRAERFEDRKAARIVIGTNHDKKESVENETFAGTRLWSGNGNGEKESFHETVADRIIFYSNGKYRSPWMIHNNTRDGYTFFMPLNENRVKHVIGRSDKRLHDIHTNEITLNGVRLKMMIKDIMNRIGYRGVGNWADLIN
ncbi:MAG: phage tail spike protein [Streptococcus parasanguinis]|nr:phage tail spike protein [Streptococcus parasanguinis]